MVEHSHGAAAMADPVADVPANPLVGRGERLAQGLADDRERRERLRRKLARQLAWGRGVESYGRNGCTVVGFGIALFWVSFLAASAGILPGALGLMTAGCLYGTFGFLVGGPVLVAAGRGWRRWVMRRANSLAIEDLSFCAGPGPQRPEFSSVPSTARALQKIIDEAYVAEVRNVDDCVRLCLLMLGLLLLTVICVLVEVRLASLGSSAFPLTGVISVSLVFLAHFLLPVVAAWRVGCWWTRKRLLREAAAEGREVYDPAAR